MSLPLLLALLAGSAAEAGTLVVCAGDVTVGSVAPTGCYPDLDSAVANSTEGDVIEVYASASSYAGSTTITHGLRVLGKASDQGTVPRLHRSDTAVDATLTLGCVSSCVVEFEDVEIDVQGGGAFSAVGAQLDLRVRRSELLDTTGGPFVYGGAITASEATVLADSLVIDGISGTDGALFVAMAGASLTFLDADFANVTAPGLVEAGGASAVTVTRGSFVTLDSTGVGGLFSVEESSTLSMNGSVVSDVTATGSGGVVYALAAGQVTLTDVDIQLVDTGNVGGVVASVDTDVTIDGGSLLADCSATFPGGLVYADGGALVIEDSVLRDGIADSAEGQLIHQVGVAATLTTTNVTFEDLDTQTVGALIVVEDTASASITGGTVVGGRAGSLGGGGLRSTTSSLTLDGVTFEDNQAFTGGGVMHTGGDLTIQRATFIANHATGAGGGALAGLPLTGSTVLIEGSIFEENTAAVSGGAMGLQFDGVQTVRDCSFIGNSSAGRGGALFVDLSDILVERNFFCMNDGDQGGGLFIQRAVAGSFVRNNVFIQNTANVFGGGADSQDGSEVFSHNTFFYNGHPTDGGSLLGGSFATNPPVALEHVGNAVLWSTHGSGVHNDSPGLRPSLADTLFWQNSPADVSGRWNNGTNIIALTDPIMTGLSADGDCSNDDWTPGSGSPLLNGATDGSDIGATGGTSPFLPDVSAVEICDGLDNDGDGTVDNGFPDADSDGTADCVDDCPADPLKTAPGVCGCEVVEDLTDTDGDGTADCIDVEECDGLDNDGNGVVDEGFPDGDSDGTADCVDDCPADPLKTSAGVCGCDVVEDLTDTDGDGTADCIDVEECDGLDNDGDGLTDEGFDDTDGDGIADCVDSETCDGIDNDGDGALDNGFPDSDSDGAADCVDDCPADPLKTAPGTCGCGVVEDLTDSDGNGTPDCIDNEVCDGLDNNGNGVADEGFPDTDGDGIADCVDAETCDGVDNNGNGQTDEGFDDTDGDGVADCVDSETCDGIDNDGDGALDNGFPDSDGDGAADCVDDCPADPAKTEPGTCGCGVVEDLTDTDGDGTADCIDVEECDGLDNDGNGLVDEGFPDADGDGVANCVDTEECDGVDNDGDELVDEGLTSTFYTDADGDGAYGTPVEACTQPPETGLEATDCNDGDATIHPSALEVCDGADQDCDQAVDEGLLAYWYEDADGDGVAGTETSGCEAPDGAATVGADCDDGDATVFPGADETCDGLDQDCDDAVDEDALDRQEYYLDLDGDGFGGPDTALACDGLTESTDCDDSDPAIHPLAVDRPNDAIDDNCDGYAATSVVGSSCANSSAPGLWWVGLFLLGIGRRAGGARRR
ncbi:MAG: hypothetical protein EP330_13575 [Deltaproteobacteria bacterium]|nr:MAG: hypothetical protein EP330_13575 [Deltaproteobacteria bacterium]